MTLHLAHIKYPQVAWRYANEYDRVEYLAEQYPDFREQPNIFSLPFYGQSRITGLARVNGYPVGVMINNPRHLGGSMNVAAGEKVNRFLQLCDTFHLPMVYFVDEPGFMVGLD